LLPLACLIGTVKLTPLITPTKLECPGTPLTKEPGGIVIVKLPILSVTGSVEGLIPLLLGPRVKLELIIENSFWTG
jgi:hypothetical protein